MTERNERGYTGAQLAEYLKESDDSPANWWSAIIDDPEAVAILTRLDQSLEEPVEETEMGKMILQNNANERVRRAVVEGDLSGMSAVRGFPDTSTAGGTHRLLDLVERIEDGYVGYVVGGMGTGKTDFALLLAELRSRVSDVSVGTNVESVSEKDEYICRFEELKEWVAGDGEKLFIFDEASSHASGYGSDAGQVTSKLRQTLRSFRKNRASLLIVGHTGKDVHPDVRRLANDIIRKESKTEARIYDDVDDDGRGEDAKMRLSGIEKTTWSYDTQEMSEWYWSS